MDTTEPLDLAASVADCRQRLIARADAICEDRDGDLTFVDDLLLAESALAASAAEADRLRVALLRAYTSPSVIYREYIIDALGPDVVNAYVTSRRGVKISTQEKTA